MAINAILIRRLQSALHIIQHDQSVAQWIKKAGENAFINCRQILEHIVAFFVVAVSQLLYQGP